MATDQQRQIDKAAQVLIERGQTRYQAMQAVQALADAGMLADGCSLRDDLLAADGALHRAQAELEHWTSGRRRKSWPRIDAVPDGLHYAAELVRAQGTEGGDAHDALLRDAAARLKALHDIAGPLLAERDRALTTLQRVRDLADQWQRELEATREHLPDADDLGPCSGCQVELAEVLDDKEQS